VNAIAELNDHADRSLLIVEDDKPFLERLSRAMETRGFSVTSCDTVSDGLAQIGKAAPAFAVVDLRLGDGNGLDVVSALKRKRPDARAIVLTGYGNIATAVTAVKMGAVDYLSKPADADDVAAALLASGTEKSSFPPGDVSGPLRWNTSAHHRITATSPVARRSTCTAAPCSGFGEAPRYFNWSRQACPTHVFGQVFAVKFKPWMPGSSPGMPTP
jgi:two-component system response regulator RegA